MSMWINMLISYTLTEKYVFNFLLSVARTDSNSESRITEYAICNLPGIKAIMQH